MGNQAAFITGGTGWLGRVLTGRFLRGGYSEAGSTSGELIPIYGRA